MMDAGASEWACSPAVHSKLKGGHAPTLIGICTVAPCRWYWPCSKDREKKDVRLPECLGMYGMELHAKP